MPLDTSAEALLSRIALLEEQVATRSLTPVVVAREAEKPSSEALEEKQVAPAKVTAPPKKETVQAAAKAPSNGENQEKRVLRPLRNWMEVVERISRSAPMTASFVKTSRAFSTESGEIIIRFDNEFGKMMMESADSQNKLRAALTTVLKREIDRVTLEVAGKQTQSSVIDEILEASEED